MKKVFSFSISAILLAVIFQGCFLIKRKDNNEQYNVDTLKIEGDWKFNKGDQKDWAKPSFNDENWHAIAAGKYWEDQGYKGYDGKAWYRKTVKVPSDLKDKVNPLYNSLALDLGCIDDVDETFVNGKLIGHSGEFENSQAAAYSKKRSYIFDAKTIRWGKENTIAVRVNDFGGGGGLYKGPYCFRTTSWVDFVYFQASINGNQGVFEKKETIKPSLLLKNDSKEILKGSILCTIYTDRKEMLEVRKQKFELSPNNEREFKFSYKGDTPGFYRAEFSIRCDKKNAQLKEFVNFAIRPEAVESKLTRPSDFDLYWKKAKAELENVDPRFKMTLIDSLSSTSHKVYLVEMYSLDNALIRGWYTVPQHGNIFPAILQVQGYSSEQGPNISFDDFAVLALNIRGHGNSCDMVNPGFPGYILNHITNKDKYIYRGAYMDCIRAVDFICSRPEVDKKRIAVMGGSQGGALSFATAALDERIKLCAPDIPFLSDFRNYFQVAVWPANEFKEFIAQHPSVTWNQIYAVLDYIDIKNLAPWIHCPLLMCSGLKDQTCPSSINFAAYNKVQSSDKEYRVYSEQGHEVPAEHYKYKMKWIRKHFRMQTSSL
jgi:cephalosporin-C deacetylase